MTSTGGLRAAYDGTAGAWGRGPDRVFGALAEALLARGPVWTGLTVADIGAGTGTASRRLAAAGAVAVPVDTATAMLAVGRPRCRCSPVGGDARALPLRDAAVDAAVLGFVLNHLVQPVVALTEARRVVRPGGWVLGSTWARGREHPVRALVQDALGALGWQPPRWYVELKERTTPLTDTAHGLTRCAETAGLSDVDVAEVDVAVSATPQDMVEWRLGLPHTAPFVASLGRATRDDLLDRLAAQAAAGPPLVCGVVLLSCRVSGQPG